MAKLVDRAKSSRGQQTRDNLVDAALSLLAEGGWSTVSTRAVAARSGSNAGLIHYHFGGLPGLRLAVAEKAGEAAVGPIVATFLASSSITEALDAIEKGIANLTADERLVGLAVQLIAGASQDPELGAAFRQSLAEARTSIADWASEVRPDWSRDQCFGFAALVAALIDGLLLHRGLDENAPVRQALIAFAELTERQK